MRLAQLYAQHRQFTATNKESGRSFQVRGKAPLGAEEVTRKRCTLSKSLRYDKNEKRERSTRKSGKGNGKDFALGRVIRGGPHAHSEVRALQRDPGHRSSA
jgi:hypothetical protein